MTPIQFQEFVQALRREADTIAQAKGQDYAGPEDVCANFHEAARNTGMTPYQCWLIYFDKHAAAIRNAIKANPQYPQAASEPLRSRVVDALNYLQLLAVLLAEDQP